MLAIATLAGAGALARPGRRRRVQRRATARRAGWRVTYMRRRMTYRIEGKRASGLFSCIQKNFFECSCRLFLSQEQGGKLLLPHVPAGNGGEHAQMPTPAIVAPPLLHESKMDPVGRQARDEVPRDPAARFSTLELPNCASTALKLCAPAPWRRRAIHGSVARPEAPAACRRQCRT